jgi:hypothetical protein
MLQKNKFTSDHSKVIKEEKEEDRKKKKESFFLAFAKKVLTKMAQTSYENKSLYYSAKLQSRVLQSRVVCSNLYLCKCWSPSSSTGRKSI